jgi:hypothetical protein
MLGFWWSQVAFLAALIAVPAVADLIRDPRPRLPRFDTEPIHIGPLHDNPLLVTDDQLTAVLKKLEPRLRHSQPKINYVDHALRFGASMRHLRTLNAYPARN